MKKSLIKEFMGSYENALVEEYVELLVNRITHSSMSLEHDLGIVDDSKNAIRLSYNMRAFKYLLEKNNMKQDLTEELIIQTANMVNDSSVYISTGYRSVGNFIASTDIPIETPSNIAASMEMLVAQYNEIKNDPDVDPFYREACFHIAFIRIHPFEDGNGRTGRLLLNYNLLKEGIAPVVITDDLTTVYQSYIAHNDVNGLANLFEKQSQKEEKVVEHIMKEEIYSQKDEVFSINFHH